MIAAVPDHSDASPPLLHCINQVKSVPRIQVSSPAHICMHRPGCRPVSTSAAHTGRDTAQKEGHVIQRQLTSSHLSVARSRLRAGRVSAWSTAATVAAMGAVASAARRMRHRRRAAPYVASGMDNSPASQRLALDPGDYQFVGCAGETLVKLPGCASQGAQSKRAHPHPLHPQASNARCPRPAPAAASRATLGPATRCC